MLRERNEIYVNANKKMGSAHIKLNLSSYELFRGITVSRRIFNAIKKRCICCSSRFLDTLCKKT